MGRLTATMQGMRWVRRGVAATAALLALGATYVVFCAVATQRTTRLPIPAGGDAIGRRTFEWTDQGRRDALAPHPGSTPRRLSVWIWYPAVSDRRDSAYAPGLWAKVHWPGLVGLGESSFAAIRTHSESDAPPDVRPHHLVVLAPGLGFSIIQYQAMAEALASHGYVVAGFTPTYSSNVAVLGNRVVGQSQAGGLPDGSLYRPDVHAAALRVLTEWVGDARFVSRESRTAVKGVSLFPGVLYAGHSFGGATALEACREDRSCVGAADIDGLDLGQVSTSGLDRPLLLLGHENSCVTASCRPPTADDRRDLAASRALVRMSTGPAWSVTLDGTQHFDFTDYAAYRLMFPLRRLLPLGDRPGPAALVTGEECLLDFADRATRQRSSWNCLGGDLPRTHVRSWVRGE
jgi:hypothetical protein